MQDVQLASDPQLTGVGAGVVGQLVTAHVQYEPVQPTKLPVWLPASQVPLYEHHPHPPIVAHVLHDV